MATVLIPEVSKKNKYHIPRHRFYELKHFCLQYKEWKVEVAHIDARVKKEIVLDGDYSNPTADQAARYAYFKERIEVVEKCAWLTDETMGKYILLAVTQGLSFLQLKMQYDMPCSKNTYYDRYRKFFWLLNDLRP